MQLRGAVDKRSVQINKLEKRINEIVDRIYKDFSKSVGVANIREYEENQLKAAQDMAEERLSVSGQLAKLKYQYVLLTVSISYNSMSILLNIRLVYIMRYINAGMCVCICMYVYIYTVMFSACICLNLCSPRVFVCLHVSIFAFMHLCMLGRNVGTS